MIQNKIKSSRAPNGNGSIRKKTITKNGKSYTYWEGRYTSEIDAVNGRQIQRSITGKTQKEVLKHLRMIAHLKDIGCCSPHASQPTGKWLIEWVDTYLCHVKESTRYNYKRSCELYIIPALGNINLISLNTETIQKFYNSLSESPYSLSAKTIRDIHGILHQALQQAVDNFYISLNPSDACKLPKRLKKDFCPIEDHKLPEFIEAIKGHSHEYIYTIALFTGLRVGEILGLTWDCIDFERGVMTVKQQLRRYQEKGGKYYISTPKNSRSRTIALPETALYTLQKQKEKLTYMEANAEKSWVCMPILHSDITNSERNFDLVFRNDSGGPLSYRTVYDCFKRIVSNIGIPYTRFHDLRHTYALVALQSGDGIKTLQENLGHATAAFTLDYYGHITDKMKHKSAKNIENYVQSIARYKV